jgi:RNA polymerase sigma factor (sigma-70 family)
MEELTSLVIRAQGGDLDAYGIIVRQFQDMAYGYGYSVLGDFHLAQDAAQEAFIQAYRDLPTLREPTAFPAWFRRIIFKHCDRLTRGKQLSMIALEAAVEMASEEPGPDELVEEQEMKDGVLQAIRGLPESERMVTTLFYINGYSQNEIADFLEVPVTTVRNRLYTSRKRLKQRMMDMVDKTLKSVPLPSDFADVVVRMVASEEDLQRVAEFGFEGKLVESVAEARKREMFVVGEEGQVESAGQLSEGTYTIGSTVVKSAGSWAGVAGESEAVPDPAFVRGYQGHFKLARDRGIHLAIVHGSQYDHAFCGFVPCFYYAVATLPCKKARSIVTSTVIREASDERERQAGQQALDRDPYRTRMSASPIYVVERDGAPEGYFLRNPNPHAGTKYGLPFKPIGGITLKTREAARAVLKFTGELAEKAGYGEILFRESHMTMITQTILSLGGTYLLRGSCDLVGLDAEMAAIVDLIGLTQDLHGEFQSRIDGSSIHRTDGAFSIEMGGTTVGFVVRSGQVEIVTRKQKVHRVLPRWVVTRLYVGYYSGEDVLRMGPIPYDRSDGRAPDDPDLDMKELRLPEKEAMLFKALFPKLWPCSMPDPDVWPWVIGKEYTRYRHGDEEPVERKAQIDALRLPWIGY